MTDRRIEDLLGHIRQAATDACSYVAGMTREQFLADRRTQQAVIMNIIIIGEAASKLMDLHADFVLEHPNVPWRSMRGMRNRIAHGYFDIDVNVVWSTVQQHLQPLIETLPHTSN